MSVPTLIQDGDYKVGKQDGPDRWRMPFYSTGDGVSFECIRDYVYTAALYKPLAPMAVIQTKRGRAYLVNEGEAEPQECGLLKVTRTFASVPVNRNEYSSYTKAFQFRRGDELAENVVTVPARTLYEYSLAPFQPITAPRIALLFDILTYYGNWTAYNSGAEIPAKDSETGIYKGRIYYRETIYVKYPSASTYAAS